MEVAFVFRLSISGEDKRVSTPSDLRLVVRLMGVHQSGRLLERSVLKIANIKCITVDAKTNGHGGASNGHVQV